MKEKILKYFKTICLWILIISFIVSSISFVKNVSNYLTPSKIDKNPTDENLIHYTKSLEDNLDNLTKDLKDIYGENYPALGIIYYKTVLHYSSETLVQNFIFEIICGFGVGNVIYFIFIAKYKKYKLFIVLVIVLFITSIFLSLSDILTNVVNGEKIDFSLSNLFWNMETTSIPYTITAIILITIQKIYSTYIAIRDS